MTVSAVRPWRTALQRERSLPSGVLGPVLFSALRRLASICLSELIDIHQQNWLRSATCKRMATRPVPGCTSARSVFAGRFSGIFTEFLAGKLDWLGRLL